MEHLVGVAEVAAMLGISKQRVNQLVRTDPRFPKAEAKLTAGRIWRREAIEAWARETGRLPAEEPKRSGGPRRS